MADDLTIDEQLAAAWQESRGGQLWDPPIPCELIDVETGRIMQWVNPVYSQLQQQSSAGSGTVIAYGQHDPQRFWYPDGILAERPMLWPETLAVAVGEPASLPVPAGSYVTYMRPSTEHRSGYLAENYDVAEDDSIAFETELAGEYRLILRPPFPYQRQELRVTVL